jgi:hypothetical protein
MLGTKIVHGDKIAPRICPSLPWRGGSHGGHGGRGGRTLEYGFGVDGGTLSCPGGGSHGGHRGHGGSGRVPSNRDFLRIFIESKVDVIFPARHDAEAVNGMRVVCFVDGEIIKTKIAQLFSKLVFYEG